MIHYQKSDITKVDFGVIAHGVNCQRRMGAGVALAIRNKWPEVYEAYMNNIVDEGKERTLLGSAHAIRVGEKVWVVNCYTQEKFGGAGTKWADAKAIERSLRFAFSVALHEELPLHTVKIGSDLGGLDWETEVRPIFEALNTEYGDVEVIIHYI